MRLAVISLLLFACVSTIRIEKEYLFSLPEVETPMGFRVSFDRTQVSLDAIDYVIATFQSCVKRNAGLDLDLDILREYKIIVIAKPFDPRSGCEGNYCNGETSEYPIKYLIVSKKVSEGDWADWMKHEMAHIYMLQADNHSEVYAAGGCFIHS